MLLSQAQDRISHLIITGINLIITGINLIITGIITGINLIITGIKERRPGRAVQEPNLVPSLYITEQSVLVTIITN